MRSTISFRQLTRAVSDGTGLTQEEVWLLAAVTASVAVLSGLLRAVDAVLRIVDDLNQG
jgi:alkylhydroperoxidase/carboxymuconolactone decarboxylase family protein YurZ